MTPRRAEAWLALGLIAAGCNLFPDRPVELPEAVEVVHEDGLGVLDLFPGRGPGASQGDTLLLEYELFVEGHPEPFESSLANGERLVVRLGEGLLFPALERGLLGLAPEGRRRLRLPPELAFGEGGVEGVVPPDAVIVGTFELLELRRAPSNSDPSDPHAQDPHTPDPSDPTEGASDR